MNKGLTLCVLYTKFYPAPSYTEITLVGENVPGISEPKEDAPAFLIAKFGLYTGESIKFLRRPGQFNVAHSGCFAFSHDSRFRELSDYPLPIYLTELERQNMITKS